MKGENNVFMELNIGRSLVGWKCQYPVWMSFIFKMILKIFRNGKYGNQADSNILLQNTFEKQRFKKFLWLNTSSCLFHWILHISRKNIVLIFFLKKSRMLNIMLCN